MKKREACLLGSRVGVFQCLLDEAAAGLVLAELNDVTLDILHPAKAAQLPITCTRPLHASSRNVD